MIIMENKYESFMELASSRWSVRKFKDEKITQEELDKILLAGGIAPTADNHQPQKILILQSEKALEAIRQLTPCTYDAPIVLLICSDFTESWTNVDGFNSGEMDAVICGVHMMLEAWELGIGSCWVRSFDLNKVIDAFTIPRNVNPIALLPLGYPADDASPNDSHFFRKPYGDNCIYL